jgi:transposase
MAAIIQIRHKHSDGRAYYERKIADGKPHKEALRCLKRRISDAIYARLRADARLLGPGRQPGNHSVSRAAGSLVHHLLVSATVKLLMHPRCRWVTAQPA